MFYIRRLPPDLLLRFSCGSIGINGSRRSRFAQVSTVLFATRLDRGCACSLLYLACFCRFPTTNRAVGHSGSVTAVEADARESVHRGGVRCEFSKGNQKFNVDGFYDGNQTWKIRFMPDEQGEWTYKTRSNDLQLDGKSGSFIVGPPGPHNHGPVRVSNTYHFAYADGTPYFLLGTTLYNWLNRDPELEQRTLNTLSKQPFNKARFLIFPKWMVFNHVEPSRFPYVRKADGSFDLDRFDPEFFAHYEARLRNLEALDIEADIILFHPYDKWGFAEMSAQHDKAYLRYVIARFGAFRNVWWTVANGV